MFLPNTTSEQLRAELTGWKSSRWTLAVLPFGSAIFLNKLSMLAAAMLTLQHSLALLQCLNRFLITQPACVLAQLLQSWPTLCDPVDCSPSGASVHGDSPGKYTRVGCHALLQGTFPIRRLSLQISCSSCGRPGKPPSPNSCCCFSSPLLLPSCLLVQVCVHCRKITNWVSTRKRINTRSHDLILIRIFSKYIYTYIPTCIPA